MTESNYDAIRAAIDAAIDSGTFNLAAIERVRQLQEEYVKIEQNYEHLNQAYTLVQKERDQVKVQLAAQEELVKRLEASEAAVAQAGLDLQIKEAKLEGRENAHSENLSFLERLLANRVIRERLTVPVVVPGFDPANGGYPAAPFVSREEQTKEQEEG